MKLFYPCLEHSHIIPLLTQMTGKEFDPMDIRSEIGSQNVKTPDVTTSASVSPEDMFKLIAISEDPNPIEEISPGDAGNEIDVDNPPDFETLNQAFPLPPPLRRSKRQAGYDPNFSEPKKLRPAPKNVLYTDLSSEDDSEDRDFEIVVRPRTQLKIGESSKQSIYEVKETTMDNDEDISLAEILASLKKENKSKVQIKVDSPDPEILEEFAHNLTSKSISLSSVSESSSKSAGYAGEKELLEDSTSNDISDVAPDVVNTDDNIDIENFDLDRSFSAKFYTESALVLWPLFVNRGLIEERIIDLEAYTRQNLVEFLKDRRLLSTVTNVVPYCRTVVYEFYCNLLSGVGDVKFAKFGTVFVRDKLYEFSPAVINKFFGTPEVDNHDENPDLDMATIALTGGLMAVFPEHPKKLVAAKLRSFYSILHKTAIRNWTLSTNSTVVTSNQLSVLYAIGTRQSFNLENWSLIQFYSLLMVLAKEENLPFLP